MSSIDQSGECGMGFRKAGTGMGKTTKNG